MVNIHTDDRVLRVKTFLSFKVNPTQKICSSICFFSFTFFREVIILLPRRRRGEGEGGRAGLFRGFWGDRVVLGQTVDNRLPMMGGGGRGKSFKYYGALRD